MEADGARVVDLTVFGIGGVVEALLRGPELHRMAAHLADAPGGVVHPLGALVPLSAVDVASRVHVAEFPPTSGEPGRVRVATYAASPGLLLNPGDAVAHPGDGMGLVATPAIGALLAHAGEGFEDADGEAAIAGYVGAIRWMRVGGSTPGPVCVAVSIGPVAVPPSSLEERRRADGTYDLGCALDRDGSPLTAGRWRDLPTPLGRLVALASREGPFFAGDLVVAVLPRVARVTGTSTLAAGDQLTLTSDGLGRWAHQILAPLPVAD